MTDMTTSKSRCQANRGTPNHRPNTLEGIEATVDALADATCQRDVSAVMAVAQLKRSLPDESHRIGLHSLVTARPKPP